MAYELTLRAGEGTLVRPQEYDYHWCYERGIITKAWLDVFEKTGEARFLEAAQADVDRFVTEDGQIVTYEMKKYALDDVNMGRTALRLFARTGQTKYERACLLLLEQLKGQPKTPEGGFWHKAVYPGQMWLDGIFMACPFLVEAGVMLNRPELLEEAARQMHLIYEKTLLPSGLHVHAWDSAKKERWADPETGRSAHVWGRAMGWYMMAYSDILESLPGHSPLRPELAEEFCTMAQAVLSCVGPDELFHQVMDMPAASENYGESSCTAMFCYALAKGARLGLLGDSARAQAEKSMDALLETNVTVGEDGYPVLEKICKVAGLGGNPYRDGSYAYYLGETVCSGDTKGTAPFLMALCEMER